MAAIVPRFDDFKSRMRYVDLLIVGQGLAGTAVAWNMHERGASFLVVDECAFSTSSRIAAGLITPVTGQRAATCWEWSQASQQADEYYRRIEQLVESQFYRTQSAVRLYQNQEESAKLIERFRIHSNPNIDDYGCDERERDSQYYRNDFGGFQMPNARRLETATYIDASRSYFMKQDCFLSASIDVEKEITHSADAIAISKLNVVAKHLVLTQGHVSMNSSWFPSLPISLVHGDILSIEVEKLFEERTMHCGIWLVPNEHVGIGRSFSFLVGATYRRERFDGLPSLEGRVELETKLRSWLKVPFQVVGHSAGIRPGSYDQRPLLGPSLLAPNVWILNGLGGKGALYAPWMARLLVRAILDGEPIPWNLLWTRRGK
jgi:glycine oxidase